MPSFEEQAAQSAKSEAAGNRLPYLKVGDYVLEVEKFWNNKDNTWWGVEAKVVEANQTESDAIPSRVGSSISIGCGVGDKFPESAHKTFKALVSAVSRKSVEQLNADPDVYTSALKDAFGPKNILKGRKFRASAYLNEAGTFTKYNFNTFE